jgi:hypothetical protein
MEVTPMRPIVLLPLLLVAACSKAGDGGSSPATDSVSYDVAPTMTEAAVPRAPTSDTAKEAGTPPIAVAVPKMAYAYRYGFILPQGAIAGAQTAHVALCDKLGPARCQVLALDRKGGETGAGTATLKLRVASAEARGFAAALERAVAKSGGRTADTSIEAEDVSKQISDVEARIRQRELLVERLTEILRTRHGKVSELVEAERSVAAAQEEIDQARSWLAELKARVAMSTFDIRYTPVAASSDAVPARLSDSIAASASAFVMGLSGILTLLIYLAPWLAIAALGWWGWRTWQRRRPAAESDRP